MPSDVVVSISAGRCKGCMIFTYEISDGSSGTIFGPVSCNEKTLPRYLTDHLMKNSIENYSISHRPALTECLPFGGIAKIDLGERELEELRKRLNEYMSL